MALVGHVANFLEDKIYKLLLDIASRDLGEKHFKFVQVNVVDIEEC